MAYVPNSGSVVAFQSDPTKLVGTVSVIGAFSPSSVMVLNPVSVLAVNPNPSSVYVLNPVSTLAVNPNPASVQVVNPVSILATTQSGIRITSVISSTPSSMLAGASIFGQLPAGTAPLGSVATLQGTNPWIVSFGNSSILAVPVGSVIVVLQSSSIITLQQAQSIVGTYAEDAGHTTADKGLFTLKVRNDAVASFVSANLEYAPGAVDSAGRTLMKPFAAEESRVEGVASVVHTSVTTLVAAAGAGLRNYITDVFLSNGGSVATTVTFRSQGGTSILGNFIVPAGGGNNAPHLAIPMRTPANETFDFQASNQVSVLYANVFGFKAP